MLVSADGRFNLYDKNRAFSRESLSAASRSSRSFFRNVVEIVAS